MHKRSNKSNEKINVPKINEQLSIYPKVRLVTEAGAEIVSYDIAIQKAREANLDLVEVSSSQEIPVCRIIDYGKYRFEQIKKIKEAKKRQHTITIKEIKIRPRIDSHDYEIKKRQAIDFLGKGDKLKITLRFKGREMAHTEIGMTLISKLVDELKEYGVAEKSPSQEGRAIVVLINPKT
ncbi:MAG: translation initiation factor IF-3 [Leptospiraceae bacterium]|nr:translation initiation factor IF-3 [Leptospiraceae bacterium]MCP5498401.1 translation initiation factor IF-3 [Leptospiraceae bacterium]